jgi:small-conductance mechanosensitive channel
VGIGFGLQAIVNNFASGLILLFERPVKVGDTIQIGDQLGEVRDLGLRATVIKTYDSAEIVVPNSDLITGQLTNWTLAERRIRLKLPVGVAYGSDVEQVMALLMECAAENPKALKTPAPRVLFLAFGASSLDFELRVWIGEFTDRRIVQSDINRAIEKKLREAGIEIPFPQQDIYLRGLPEALSPKADNSEDQK